MEKVSERNLESDPMIVPAEVHDERIRLSRQNLAKRSFPRNAHKSPRIAKRVVPSGFLRWGGTGLRNTESPVNGVPAIGRQ